MNRAQRRAAGLKGKRLKKMRDCCCYTVTSRHIGRVVGKALYKRLKGEQK